MYPSIRRSVALNLALLSVVLTWGCADESKVSNQARAEVCVAPDGTSAPEFLRSVGCRSDFDLLASEPLDTSLPGARSVKVLLDQADGNALYFQNSQKFPIHHQFAFGHLSGQGRPFVPSLSEFNRTEYYSPE